MAIEPVFEEVKLNSRKRLATSQTVAEARLLPAPGTAISRVLSISADCAISACEVFTGEARYSGRVNFNVLFLDSDGNNRCLGCSADFSDKTECAQITSSVRPHVEASVLDTDVVSVAAGEIKLASVVEINLVADIEQAENLLSAGGEGIYTHDDALEYSRLAAAGSATFSSSAAAENVKMAEVLLGEHRAIIKRRTAGADFITAEGVIISDVCGVTEDGLITSCHLETPFEEEIPASGARPGDAVVADVTVSGTAEVEKGEESSTLTLGYDLSIDFCVYSDERTTVIADAFSVSHELLITAESLSLSRVKQAATISDRVDGNVTLEVNMPIVDSVLAATGLRLNVTNAAAGDGEALIEGLVSGSVIYYSAEASTESSVAVELPFSLKARVENLAEGDEITARGEVVAMRVKIRRGNEIALSADIAAELFIAEKCVKTVITALGEGEARALPTAAFSVHVVRRGESLWDVARTLGTTPELVMMQNPDLGVPMTGGERVVLYRHLEK